MISARRHRGRVSRGAWRVLASLPLAAALIGAAPRSAAAGDFDWLRGPVGSSGYMRWDGLNFGGQLGVANMDTDFGSSTSNEIAYILRNTTLESEAAPSSWTTLPHNIKNGQSYGVFLGYSTQWDELVIGFDAAYNHVSNLNGQASDYLNRELTTSDGVDHKVYITARASNKLTDYATARLRAGYAIGQFLPYAFVGGAVGRFDYSSSATVTDDWTPAGGATTHFGPQTDSDSRNGAITAGFTTGLGIDVAVLPNVFLRAEYEFVTFGAVNGIRSSINSGKVGIGVKF